MERKMVVAEGDDLPIAHVANDPDLIAPPAPEKGAIDNTTIFLTYLSFLGDVEKTAAACNISPFYVDTLAQQEKWGSKVAALATLRKDKGADALARELNRTSNFVQGVRIRNLIDKVLADVFNNEVRFEDLITMRGKNSDNTTMKGIVELAKAAEIAHRLTYQALGDSMVERATRDEEAEANQVSLGVLRALAAGSPAQKIIDPSAPARALIIDEKKAE
jgi:hypothetical protein